MLFALTVVQEGKIGGVGPNITKHHNLSFNLIALFMKSGTLFVIYKYIKCSNI